MVDFLAVDAPDGIGSLWLAVGDGKGCCSCGKEEWLEEVHDEGLGKVKKECVILGCAARCECRWQTGSEGLSQL